MVITRDTSGSVREGVLRELEIRRGKIAAAAKAKAEAQTQTQTQAESKEGGEPVTDAIVAPSLDAALEQLDSEYAAQGKLGKVFVIGGAEIYASSLRSASAALKRPVRIVMTNVVRKLENGDAEPFECDTFFPEDKFSAEDGWRGVSSEEVSEWVGEEVTGEWKREGDVEVQMVGFERLN